MDGKDEESYKQELNINEIRLNCFFERTSEKEKTGKFEERGKGRKHIKILQVTFVKVVQLIILPFLGLASNM